VNTRRLIMRNVLLALVLTSGVVATAFARTGDLPLMTALFVDADAVQTVSDSSGLRGTMNLSGNVLLIVNGVRITADSAVVGFGSSVIELNGGSARIEMPKYPTSIRLGDRHTR
jgi:hypothetical protein